MTALAAQSCLTSRSRNQQYNLHVGVWGLSDNSGRWKVRSDAGAPWLQWGLHS